MSTTNDLLSYEKRLVRCKDLNFPNQESIVTLGEDPIPQSKGGIVEATEGFVFYTNYKSEKGRAILAYPKVVISFLASLRTSGNCKRSCRKSSSSNIRCLFFFPSVGSQLGAMASMQSEAISSREALESQLSRSRRKVRQSSPQRPDHWGGFLVRPKAIEFWQGRPNRLHDRLQFQLGGMTVVGLPSVCPHNYSKK